MRKASTPALAHRLEDIPNVGPRIASDFRSLGITKPSELKSKDPYMLYEKLCKVTNTRQDPCVLDTFIAVARFMEGERPRPWWHYTPERKSQTRLKAQNSALLLRKKKR